MAPSIAAPTTGRPATLPTPPTSSWRLPVLMAIIAQTLRNDDEDRRQNASSGSTPGTAQAAKKKKKKK